VTMLQQPPFPSHPNPRLSEYTVSLVTRVAPSASGELLLPKSNVRISLPSSERMPTVTNSELFHIADDNLQGLWDGGAKLSNPEHIVIAGTTRIGALQDPGRFTVIQVGSSTYAFFRQWNASIERFEIYRAVSSDGLNFTVEYNPVIKNGDAVSGYGTLEHGYDPDVIAYGGYYYLCFEGATEGTGVCSLVARASSITGAFAITGFAVRYTGSNQENSASTPNFLKSGINADCLLTWVNVHYNTEIVTHHQKAFPGNDLTSQITTNPNEGQLPQTTGWANKNFGAASCIYEAPYYYMFYEGSDTFGCSGQWGIGLCRTTDMYNKDSWAHDPNNPLLWAGMSDSCWISYPKIIMLDGKYYLYYQNPYTNYPTTQTIYRRQIQINTAADINNDRRVDLKDFSVLAEYWLAEQ